MLLPRYSMGIGDRFAHQGVAQLQAFVAAQQRGISVTPVWNKSNREHLIVHTEPESVRREADAAVAQLGWKSPYFVDADHIGLKTVDRFIQSSDFFTLDVADFTGKAAPDAQIGDFMAKCAPLIGSLDIPGIDRKLELKEPDVRAIARKYLLAVSEAGKLYRYIAGKKADMVVEVSMDETEQPQTPAELLVILFAISREKIPAQTIAPKFTGRFNKGVDYVGDLAAFEREFNDDIAIIAYAVKQFALPANLKLSVHSGSDKFSIYPLITRALERSGAGLHLKTAGTTWLEELIGLASADGEGLAIAKAIYAQALTRFDELCGPYATVIDINCARLPPADEVARWSSQQFADALRHVPTNAAYNPNLRQLLHVGYKLAAEMGPRYIEALQANQAIIARNVTENLLDRHLLRVFGVS